MSKTETEVLLERINLSIPEVYDIIKRGVTSRYNSMRQLKTCTTVDDLTQNVLLFYLDKMETANDIRLNHYIKKYNDREHIINLIKQTSYQLPIYYARTQEVINISKTCSLDYEYCIDNHYVAFGEFVEDVKASKQITNNVMHKDFMMILKKELQRINYKIIKNNRLKHINRKNRHTEKYSILGMRKTALENTEIQLNIIKDLCDGYKQKELRKRHRAFSSNLQIIRGALKTIIYKYNN